MDIKSGKGRFFEKDGNNYLYKTKWTKTVIGKIIFVKEANRYDIYLRNPDATFRNVGSGSTHLDAAKILVSFLG